MAYVLKYSDYAESLKEGKLLGLKCNDCGTYITPPKLVCVNCMSENLMKVEMSGKGEIKTFTIIRVPPEGFQSNNMIALVELEEGPWMMGNIEGIIPDEATMELLGRKVSLGSKVISGDTYSAGERIALTFTLIS